MKLVIKIDKKGITYNVLRITYRTEKMRMRYVRKPKAPVVAR